MDNGVEKFDSRSEVGLQGLNGRYGQPRTVFQGSNSRTQKAFLFQTEAKL